jgi:sortase A
MLCLLGAAFFAGYVVWLLWGTGLETARAQDELRGSFAEQVATRVPPSQAPDGPLLPGSAYAQILIPRIDLDMIVVQGTDHESLKSGPGHYPDTADPWDDAGRVGIAGHRTTYLAPFFSLDQIRQGDRIVLRTHYGVFRYLVQKSFIIPASGSGYVLRQTAKPTLVLTTCNPRYSASQRLIVVASQLAA